jgi:hypothetical protein
MMFNRLSSEMWNVNTGGAIFHRCAHTYPFADHLLHWDKMLNCMEKSQFSGKLVVSVCQVEMPQQSWTKNTRTNGHRHWDK